MPRTTAAGAALGGGEARRVTLTIICINMYVLICITPAPVHSKSRDPSNLALSSWYIFFPSNYVLNALQLARNCKSRDALPSNLALSSVSRSCPWTAGYIYFYIYLKFRCDTGESAARSRDRLPQWWLAPNSGKTGVFLFSHTHTHTHTTTTHTHTHTHFETSPSNNPSTIN